MYKARVFSGYAVFVTLVLLAVYTYRDIWPLLTYTLYPEDDLKDRLLWSKVALAGLLGVVLPLVEPMPYIPVDPEVRRRTDLLLKIATKHYFA